MVAPLSIIIPTNDSARELPDTVTSLFEGLQDGLIKELIICDSTDDKSVETIADKLGAVFIKSVKGRGTQLREGAKYSSGEWMLFLHADTHLGEGWNRIVSDFIDSHPDRAGYFRLKFRRRGFFPHMVAGWANLRSTLFDLPYGDQGLLISRTLYDQIGGFQAIPLMEDVDFCRKLKGKLMMLDGLASTSARRQVKNGWIRSGLGNLWMLTRYFLGSSPEDLFNKYYK